MQAPTTRVIIACGGTGGHVFPGVAVARELCTRGAAVTLLLSDKSVDQEAVTGLSGVTIKTVPAVGLSLRTVARFLWLLIGSTFSLFLDFRHNRPSAVLSMGGFTSAAPVLAGFFLGVPVMIHEANSVPGKANRFLARFARTLFLHFEESRELLNHSDMRVVGMPVRAEFVPRCRDREKSSREKIGLDPRRPVLVVVGGSQGARPVNDLIVASLELIGSELPELQILHIAGSRDLETVQSHYARSAIDAQVEGFYSEMADAFGAASVIVTRSGASSLAEIARVGVPAVLIPFPQAADDHQTKNAGAFVKHHRAIVIIQKDAHPGSLVAHLKQLIAASSDGVHAPALGTTTDAAVAIADAIGQITNSLKNKSANQSDAHSKGCERSMAV